ncbi:hypothetical protein AXK56_11000 [Tsukamurella pulmonis]|uniref:DNA-binding transcriptional regulator, IclR family n=1 Tax=Tsukamurella pulmonis TaxID=47312 RepID=A0A1H1GG55_9ACTN|nr:hypothetical protein AXK56_11000 [Tsukamurella pulmonis]SDR11826.1 DNA-binding transcriptional regulator, IclR family [Tsukamurella pulmonis]SUP17367.1 Negative regulator of allantoin and glyoxylate utilization operons [Tsukamurella pulmonis]
MGPHDASRGSFGLVQRFTVVKRPEYAVRAADNTLQLLLLLQAEPDGVRVQQVAEHLGMAPSSAHRLLSTLVYRGFASQDAARRYVPGPILNGRRGVAGVAGLPAPIAGPLADLAHTTGETVSLLRRGGASVEFVGSIESRQRLRVGERTGTVLPAHLTSGGKALLAAFGDAPVRRMYTGSAARRAGIQLSAPDLESLIGELAEVRAHGYALNFGLTEAGISAIGMAVPAEAGHPPTFAVAVGAPSVRADVLTDPATRAALLDTCAALSAPLSEIY